MKNGLEPIVFNDSKVLILGSLPSDKSIENKKYYDNNRNQFWNILSFVFEGESIQFNSYEQKIEFLKKHHIALWDVIKCAKRKGSLDINISDEEFNDILGLIEKYNIKYVFVNGQKAAKSFRKYLWMNKCNKDYVCLPSSSSANTFYNLNEKKYLWLKLFKTCL